MAHGNGRFMSEGVHVISKWFFKGLLLTVDIEKTFDSVNCSFFKQY